MRRWPIVGAASCSPARRASPPCVVSGASGDDVVDADQPAVERSHGRRQRPVTSCAARSSTAPPGTARRDPLVLAGAGTLTSLPASATSSTPATPSSTVDGAPVVVLSGPTPMWRALGPGRRRRRRRPPAGVRAHRARVRRGRRPRRRRRVDERHDRGPSKAFQEDHGQDDDGTVDARRDRVDRRAGARRQRRRHRRPAGRRRPAIEVTGAEPSVDVAADVADADLLPLGGTGSTSSCRRATTSPARCTSVGVTRDRRGRRERRVPVEITLDGAEDLADGLPVDVDGRRSCRPRASLAVPVEALLALAEGGYAVEVADWPTARPASSASSSACSPTAGSRSPATSPPATRWWCRDAPLTRRRSTGRCSSSIGVVKQYAGRAARARPRRRRPARCAAASSSSSSGRPDRASRR